jgi:hypothetical protein
MKSILFRSFKFLGVVFDVLTGKPRGAARFAWGSGGPVWRSWDVAVWAGWSGLVEPTTDECLLGNVPTSRVDGPGGLGRKRRGVKHCEYTHDPILHVHYKT